MSNSTTTFTRIPDHPRGAFEVYRDGVLLGTVQEFAVRIPLMANSGGVYRQYATATRKYWIAKGPGRGQTYTGRTRRDAAQRLADWTDRIARQKALSTASENGSIR